MATLASMSVMLTARTAPFVKAMKKARATAARFGAAAAGIAKKVGVLGAAFAAAAAGAGLAALVKQQLAFIDANSKLADSIGISTQELAKLQHAAEITGASKETLNKSLGKMAKGIGEAIQGFGTAKVALDSLGLSAESLAQMSPDEQFRAISEAMAQLPSHAERAAVATQLFGRSGLQLINTLDLGREGLNELGAEAERLGVAFNRVEGAKIEAANDAITRMRAAFTGLVQKLTVQLAPIIEAVAKRITAFTSQGEGGVSKVAGAVRMVVKGLGILADVMKWPIIAFKSLEIVGSAVGMAISESLNSVIGLAIKAAEAFGIESDLLQGAKQFADELSDEYASNIDRLKTEIVDLANTDFSSKVVDAYDKMQMSAQAAAVATAKVKEEQAGFNAEAAAAAALVEQQAERMKTLESQAARVFEATRSPLERFTKEMEELKTLLAEGLINDETFARAAAQAKKQLEDAQKTPEPRTAARDSVFQQVRLDRVAIDGFRSRARRRQQVEDPQLETTNQLLRDLVRKRPRAVLA